MTVQAADDAPWVALVGLVRDAKAALEKIEGLAAWRAEGLIADVVMCTWAGELDRHPAVAEALHRYGFLVLEPDEPRLKMPGHMVHQKLALRLALNAMPAGARVLKLRPDLAGLTGELRSCIAGGVDLTLSLPGNAPSDIFSEKVLVHTVFPTEPFYVGDIIFMGRREDLLKIATLPYEMDLLYANLAPEQLFFLPPFMGRFPRLDQFLMVQLGILFDGAQAAHQRRAKLLASDAFLEALALHAYVLRTYFRMGFAPDKDRHDQAELERLKTVDLAEYLSGRLGETQQSWYIPGPEALGVRGEAPLQAIVEAGFKPGPLTDRLAAAVERVLANPTGGAISPVMADSDMRALGFEIRKGVEGPPPRVGVSALESSNRYRMHGADRPALTAADPNASARDEISMLRRTIDKLRLQLAAERR